MESRIENDCSFLIHATNSGHMRRNVDADFRSDRCCWWEKPKRTPSDRIPPDRFNDDGMNTGSDEDAVDFMLANAAG